MSGDGRQKGGFDHASSSNLVSNDRGLRPGPGKETLVQRLEQPASSASSASQGSVLGSAAGATAADPAARSQLQRLFSNAGVAPDLQQLPTLILTIADASRLLNLALSAHPTVVGVGPRMVAARLMQDVVIGGSDVGMSEIAARLSAFRSIIILRPDGYIARALSGDAIQRAGRIQFVDGALRAGNLSTGTFYYSDGGVFYRTDDALQKAGPPIGELALEHDAVSSAMDGVADAVVGMAAGIYQLIRHPIRSIEALTQLPSAVAQLIRNAPVYWELFCAMPLNDQIVKSPRSLPLL